MITQPKPSTRYEVNRIYEDKHGNRVRYTAEGWEAVDGDFSAREMVKNVPGSLRQYGGDMLNAIRHPVESVKALGNTLAGTAQLAIPGEQGKEDYARAVGEAINARYGSMDAFKQTLESDPVGAIADISSVLIGGGSLLPGKVGATVTKAGASVDPFNLITNTAKQTARGVPRAVTKELYDRDVKWSTVADKKGGRGARDRLTQTALDEGIPPNNRGIDRLNQVKNELLGQLDDAIDNASGTIPAVRLYDALDNLEAEIGFQMGAAADTAIIGAKRVELDDLVAKHGSKIPARDMQKFKIELGDDINWNKNTQTATKAGTKADKALRAAAREGLEDVSPEVAAINKRLGELLELEPNLVQAAARRENKNLIGLTETLGASGGATVGALVGDPVLGTSMGLALAAVKRKSAEIATYIEKLKKQGVPASYIEKNITPALLRDAAVQLGRLQETVDVEADKEVNQAGNRKRQ